MRGAVALLGTVLLAGCAPGYSHEIPVLPPAFDWQPVSPQTGKINDIAGLSALADEYPDSASVRLRLLNAQLNASDVSAATDSITWLHSRGYSFSSGARSQLLSLGVDPENLAPEPDQIARSRSVDAVPRQAMLAESVAHDQATGRYFVSTVVSRKIFVRLHDGSWDALDLPHSDSLSGMVIDEARSLLWVSSGHLGIGQLREDAFHGLIGIDTETLEEVRRIAAPPKGNPSDLAIGEDGTLYASDPLSGAIYFANPDAVAMETLIGEGIFRSPQGLATAAGDTLLYVSDYRYGLAAIYLPDRRVLRLWAQGEQPFPLDGIDGLWRHGDELIAIQNGSSPNRIIALRIAYGGVSLYQYRVLEQANPAWTESLGGFVHGGNLTYVATGQWDVFADDGSVREGREPKPTELRSLALD